MNSPRVLTICASLRAGSHHATLLKAAEAELARLGATVTRYAHLADIPHYDEDLDVEPPQIVAELRAAVGAADAVLIASPTYNFSIPGGLKDLIDWTSRPWGKAAFAATPVGIITASTGSGAGVAGAEYLEKILSMLSGGETETGVVGGIVKPITNIAKVTKTFSESGELDQPTTKAIGATVQALVLAGRGAKVANNEAARRFEISIGRVVVGYTDYLLSAELRAEGTPTIELPHTVTLPEFRGQGVASVLVRAMLQQIATTEPFRQVVPTCPFVADFIEANPSASD
jgi:chromate reductase, NAD(P)H dehydrogenase (quinone)